MDARNNRLYREKAGTAWVGMSSAPPAGTSFLVKNWDGVIHQAHRDPFGFWSETTRSMLSPILWMHIPI